MMVVCAIDRPRSAIISTRSRRLSLKRRYQRTHRITMPRSMATLEQLFYSLQLGHCRPRLVQPASIADRTVPFAPEPPNAGGILAVHPEDAVLVAVERH